MRSKGYLFCLVFCTAAAFLLLGINFPSQRAKQPAGARLDSSASMRLSHATKNGAEFRPTQFSIPLTIEANRGQADARAEFIGRGKGMTVLLTRDGIELAAGARSKTGVAAKIVRMRFIEEAAQADDKPRAEKSGPHAGISRSSGASSSSSGAKPRRKRRSSAGGTTHKRHRSSRRSQHSRKRKPRAPGPSTNPRQPQPPHEKNPRPRTSPREPAPPGAMAGKFEWHGAELLPGESNYFLGNDPAKWRTHVPHYARATTTGALPGVDVIVYGNEEGLEYDLRLAPGADARNLRLEISGADGLRLGGNGDLMILIGEREIRMRKPAMYKEYGGAAKPGDGRSNRNLVDGGYELEADGTGGFRVARNAEFAEAGASESGATL